MNPPLPPSYVNTPVAIAYAGVDDALIVTMTRILGLCWAHDYERTPALTPDQLADLTGRPRTTLYRHLAALEQELRWLRIDHSGRRLILRPLVRVQEAKPVVGSHARKANPAVGEELLAALVAAGIENPARDELARSGDLDPAWARGWHLWTLHPHRATLSNPAGAIIRRLQDHEPPPDDYLALARLTKEDEAQLRASFWTAGADLDDDLYELRALYFEVFGRPGG